MPGPGSRGNIALVPLVHAGNKSRHEKCNTGPAQGPAWGLRQEKRGPPGTEQDKASRKVAHEVSSLAKIVMKDFKVTQIHVQKKMEQGIEIAAGVIGGKLVGRFRENDSQPQ